MEILKLLKANIKHKKGSFKSIAVLMAIIVFSFTGTVSNNDNLDKALTEAHQYVNTPDITAYIVERKADRSILGRIAENPDITEVKATDCVTPSKAVLDGTETYQVAFIYPESHKVYRLFNEDFSAYIDNPEPLKEGEIYLPYSFKTVYKNIKIGSEMVFGNDEIQYKFKVKGFVAEPNFGAAPIGTKRYFVSDEDFRKIYENTDENTFARIIDAGINMREGADYFTVKKALDDSCGISEKSSLILSSGETIGYTKLYSSTGSSILVAFLILLITIVIISMWHSITTSIEMEYINLGILKSQGFTSWQIRLVYILQYFLAEIIGSVIGLILSVPALYFLGKLFQPITGLITDVDISFLKCGLMALALAVVCILFVILATRKVSKISPVRAISGGKSEIHFDSRLNAPIKAKPLSFFMGLRQFTSRGKSYIGSVFIVALLVYFMMTISILSTRLSGENIVEGVVNPNISIAMSDEFEIGDIKHFEDEVHSVDKNAKVIFSNNRYVMIDGIELFCSSYSHTELMYKPLEGRMPIYDNELALTDISSGELGKKIGDTVMIGSGENAKEFIVTGYYQSMDDIGRTFMVTSEGMYKINSSKPVCYVEMSDISLVDEASEVLDEKLGKLIMSKNISKEPNSTFDGMLELIDTICLILVLVVFGVSVIFSAVVINMICGKAFIKERTDIGILKSLGFSAGGLRIQFAFRFMIIAVIGSVIGGICSVFLTKPLLELLLRIVGVTRIESIITFTTFIIPALLICLSFFIFAYFAARKINKVEIRELISE